MVHVLSSTRRIALKALLAVGVLAAVMVAVPSANAACSPCVASHCFDANGDLWQKTLTKQRNGCQSIWMVSSRAASYTLIASVSGGVSVSTVTCGAGSVCQLINPAAIGDSVQALGINSGAPANVEVFY
jgi:hypothetical protein